MTRRLTVFGVWVGLMLFFGGLDVYAWRGAAVTGGIILTGLLVIVATICTRLLWELA